MLPTPPTPIVSASSSTNTARSRRSAPRWRGSRRRRARAGRHRRHADQVSPSARRRVIRRWGVCASHKPARTTITASEDQADLGRAQAWPSLAFDDWKDTCETLQLWTQVVGKVRLTLAPMVNHWWQVALYVTATGLTTSAMPYQGRLLQIDFDFLAHRLLLRTSD